MRNEAGYSQRALATEINREHSMIARNELGKRRVGLIEFFDLCTVLGEEPALVARELFEEFRLADSRE